MPLIVRNEVSHMTKRSVMHHVTQPYRIFMSKHTRSYHIFKITPADTRPKGAILLHFAQQT